MLFYKPEKESTYVLVQNNIESALFLNIIESWSRFINKNRLVQQHNVYECDRQRWREENSTTENETERVRYNKACMCEAWNNTPEAGCLYRAHKLMVNVFLRLTEPKSIIMNIRIWSPPIYLVHVHPPNHWILRYQYTFNYYTVNRTWQKYVIHLQRNLA